MVDINLLNRSATDRALRRGLFKNNIRKLVRSSFSPGGELTGSGPCCCNCVKHCYVGTTAKNYTITSTSITLGSCSCIATSPTFGCGGNTVASALISRMPTANFNNTFTLGTYFQNDGLGTETCQWVSTNIDSLDISYWQGAACNSTEINGFTNITINWALTRLSTGWILVLGTQGSAVSETCSDELLFYDSISDIDPGDCSGTLTFTNQITTSCANLPSGLYGSSQFDLAIASGGTVVCTPHY